MRQVDEYEWSSARAHLQGVEGDGPLDTWEWRELAIDDWSEVLQAALHGNDDERLRQSTYAGLPFGDAGFVAEMERRAGRELRLKPPGPAPKAGRANRGGRLDARSGAVPDLPDPHVPDLLYAVSADLSGIIEPSRSF